MYFTIKMSDQQYKAVQSKKDCNWDFHLWIGSEQRKKRKTDFHLLGYGKFNLKANVPVFFYVTGSKKGVYFALKSTSLKEDAGNYFDYCGKLIQKIRRNELKYKIRVTSYLHLKNVQNNCVTNTVLSDCTNIKLTSLDIL